MLKKVHLAIATVCYIGCIPYAPGTFGSLAGLLFILLVKPTDLLLLLILIILSLIGVVSSGNVERDFGRDNPRIVIDEFCGYLLSILLLPKDLTHLFLALVLFRFFDILKPPPIRNIEATLGGGFAVMLDDLAAGIYANTCIQLWRLLF